MCCLNACGGVGVLTGVVTRALTHAVSKRQVFAKWKAEGKTSTLVAGAWSRPLFVGGWQHTGDHTETVFNVQVKRAPDPSKVANFLQAHPHSLPTDAYIHPEHPIKLPPSRVNNASS